MITGPRAAFIAALEALEPAIRVSWFGDPAVNVPTAYIALGSFEPDLTGCAHVTDLTVLVIVQHDDPSKAGPVLDTAADLILDTLAPLATFVSGESGVYRDRAPSMLLTFQTRQ